MTEQNLLNSSSENSNGHVGDRLSNENQKKKTAPLVKAFSHRNSLLTDLMQVSHLQTVYNIWVALCVLLLLTTIAYYTAIPELFYRDVALIAWAAGKMYIFWPTWIALNLICVLFHQIYCTWATYRHKLPLQVSDFLFSLSFICIVTLMFTAVPYIVIKAELKPITAFAILAEQVRMFMKIYSFFIENYSKVKRHNREKDGEQKKYLCSSFGHFMYYMFAPVLIYRDSYPRTKSIDWNFVMENFFRVIACIFISYCFVLRFNVDIFSKIGKESFALHDLVLIFAGCMVIGPMMMFLIFFSILHAWLNAFAEMLRFGDRLFYKDWWNSTSFSQYYRMWNGVVYDWIHTYFYVHLQKLGLSRWMAVMTVLVVSAVVHDYIICFALGFFFPALGIVYSTIGFVCVVVTNSRTTQAWNTFLWSMLFSGWGVLIFLFSAEWYARQNCPNTTVGIMQYVVPRSLSCQILAPSETTL